ncbi:hypothetical protein Curi_c16160 [Gottschalkia acidurici 9a]|uniref:Uncharacterized protein n=1 Tax=Gottschalkia acidurici (strain ATCC 7906 / DSM 604 / BCRC 14475 / CIP 104303 / KCTC 5404 / NCIMB 10678 / 9a) TaxID=1128398 RepID=K0AZC8_GOTA9|nr:hypothetical protein [Gottschalkia acidurici]AFS78624.1 hypothetical protein Curi_c16160 [Gottschalkia acidurici 9a]
MRIDIQPSGNLTKSDLKKLDKLKQGDVIKGTIIEVNGNIAKIDLGNGEIAYGKLEIPLSLLKDKSLKFVIKDIKENLLILNPVYEDIDFNKEFVLKNKDLILDRILNLNNLVKNEKNLNILKEMIAFRMPLSGENIESIAKHIDKLLSILNLQEDETIQILSTIKEPLSEDISKLVKIKGETESLRGSNNGEVVFKENINNNTQLEKKICQI